MGLKRGHNWVTGETRCFLHDPIVLEVQPSIETQRQALPAAELDAELPLEAVQTNRC